VAERAEKGTVDLPSKHDCSILNLDCDSADVPLRVWTLGPQMPVLILVVVRPQREYHQPNWLNYANQQGEVMADQIPDPEAEVPIAVPSSKSEKTAGMKTTGGVMPVSIFVVSTIYLVGLIAVFIVFVSWRSFQASLPTMLGPLPIGVVWFGATGAVIASFRGIFAYNRNWGVSYNYWHYSRPLIGAVTGPIGALMYWVLLRLGSSGIVSVRHMTFYVAAFIFGFADWAFMAMLHSVTEVIINPGGTTPAPKGNAVTQKATEQH
jgi:hypothetical protein